ncbi:hypothetical protein [Ferruginibacter sp. SUN106]|uniref:hypothetical protein n=1 Tax=Ferruginibacter sp. SUN106 TaxID=2978348 RepID=UPI003D3625C1
MNIWHIHSKVWPSIRLWRIDNENFQVNEKGIVAAILTNPTYSIIDDKYSHLLSKLSGEVTFHKIKIFDFVLKAEYHNYIELNIENSISPDNIKDKSSAGKKIWKYGGEVFVSGELKDEFLKISRHDFKFDPGFSFFG